MAQDSWNSLTTHMMRRRNAGPTLACLPRRAFFSQLPRLAAVRDFAKEKESGWQPPRGTKDLFPDEIRRHRYVINKATAWASLWGFEEVMGDSTSCCPPRRAKAFCHDCARSAHHCLNRRNSTSDLLVQILTLLAKRCILSRTNPVNA